MVLLLNGFFGFGVLRGVTRGPARTGGTPLGLSSPFVPLQVIGYAWPVAYKGKSGALFHRDQGELLKVNVTKSYVVKDVFSDVIKSIYCGAYDILYNI